MYMQIFHNCTNLKQQQQRSLFSQASWGRLEMKPYFSESFFLVLYPEFLMKIWPKPDQLKAVSSICILKKKRHLHCIGNEVIEII